MSHASMLKARRKHQKTKRDIVGAAKLAKREAKQALPTPASAAAAPAGKSAA